MRILVHDWSGHPFQVQLSRELSKNDNVVRHVYCSSFQTPRGNLSLKDSDPANFDICPVSLSETFHKDKFIKRRSQEIKVGKLIGKEITKFKPDIVISSNAPIDAQRKIISATRRAGAKFIFWQQDIYSEAIRRILSKRVAIIGNLIGIYYQWLEYAILKRSDHIVTITDDFVPILSKHGIRKQKISVIENWAPLEEIIAVERDNIWASENMKHSGLRIVYSGTLGYKHNPQILIDMAQNINAHLYVFSEGKAANRLSKSAIEQGVNNISVHGWVSYEHLSDMLSGADILVAIIEKDAGVYCVPSKVLSYLCVGRPIVGFIPKDNLARKIIEREKAGIAGDPDDVKTLIEKTKSLISDVNLRTKMGRNGRSYAQKTFEVKSITKKFETIMKELCSI